MNIICPKCGANAYPKVNGFGNYRWCQCGHIWGPEPGYILGIVRDDGLPSTTYGELERSSESFWKSQT